MTDNTKAALDAGMRLASAVSREIEGTPHMFFHGDMILKDMSHLLPQPKHVKQTVTCTSPKSFVFNYQKYCDLTTAVYADDEGRSVTAVFDGSLRECPQWGRNKSVLKFNYAEEWRLFKKKTEEKMSGIEFSYFLENNLDFISSDDEGGLTSQEILAMASSVKVKVKGEITINETIKDGLKHLEIIDESTVKGTKGDKTINFPEVLKIRLRVFKNSPYYDFTARLRHRVTDNKVYFWFSIANVELVEESAFEAVLEDLSKKLDTEIIRGSISY